MSMLTPRGMLFDVLKSALKPNGVLWLSELRPEDLVTLLHHPARLTTLIQTARDILRNGHTSTCQTLLDHIRNQTVP